MMYSYYEDEIAHNVEVRKIRLILIESADLKPSKHLKFINDAIRTSLKKQSLNTN